MRRKKRAGRRTPPPPPRGQPRPRPRAYPPKTRLKAVRLFLEEGIPPEMISTELGVCHDTIKNWVKRYQAEGEAGLEDRPRSPRGRKHRIAPAVKEKIAEVVPPP